MPITLIALIRILLSKGIDIKCFCAKKDVLVIFSDEVHIPGSCVYNTDKQVVTCVSLTWNMHIKDTVNDTVKKEPKFKEL